MDMSILSSMLALSLLILPPRCAGQYASTAPEQKATTPDLELILSPDNVIVMPNGDLKLFVKWINHSDKALWCSSGEFSTGIVERYIYDISTDDGKAVPRIKGKERESATPYPLMGGDFCRLKPGASTEQILPGLMQVFEMNRPGKYAIRVSIADPDHAGRLLGSSNIVKVTVKAPQ